MKNADHDYFANECRTSGDLLNELRYFSAALVKYKNYDNLETLTGQLNELSKELNIEIVFYRSLNGEIFNIKKNVFCDCLVVSILETSIENLESYYCLYHSSYTEISPNNYNASEDFVREDPPLNNRDKYIIENMIKLLLGDIKAQGVSKEGEAQLKSCYDQLISRSQISWSFDNEIQEISKSYVVNKQKCSKCDSETPVKILDCRCKYCDRCLGEIKGFARCPVCKTNFTENDRKIVN